MEVESYKRDQPQITNIAIVSQLCVNQKQVQVDAF